ncbi:uncharacterized protein LOC129270371 [Lytechinus pictus]|uniref:uncharacterized protein LOC129270371 n=1 Tax=Lytechinus pictus TaxID=7653 RepID=UPI0030B9D19E
MSFIWFHSLKENLSISIIVIIVNLSACKSLLLSKNQGQDANLKFPYPCDSSEVTLQLWHNAPFYRSTENSLRSLPTDQLPRFNVQNRNETGNCYLELQISNLKLIDEETYISTVYKDGQVLDDFTAIRLQVDYPPGQVTCVEDREIAADWVLVDCTANSGSLPGKINCYQNGLWMAPLTTPIETDSLLKQTILIKKSEPTFCCSCTLDEYKSICECNDTILFQADGSSHDPCTASTESEVTTYRHTPSPENDTHSTFTPTELKECNPNKGVVAILSVSFTISLLLIFILLVYFRIKIKTIDNENQDPPKSTLLPQGHLWKMDQERKMEIYMYSSHCTI